MVRDWPDWRSSLVKFLLAESSARGMRRSTAMNLPFLHSCTALLTKPRIHSLISDRHFQALAPTDCSLCSIEYALSGPGDGREVEREGGREGGREACVVQVGLRLEGGRRQTGSCGGSACCKRPCFGALQMLSTTPLMTAGHCVGDIFLAHTLFDIDKPQISTVVHLAMKLADVCTSPSTAPPHPSISTRCLHLPSVTIHPPSICHMHRPLLRPPWSTVQPPAVTLHLLSIFLSSPSARCLGHAGPPTILALQILETFWGAPIFPLFHPESPESKQFLFPPPLFFCNVLFKVHFGCFEKVGLKALC